MHSCVAKSIQIHHFIMNFFGNAHKSRVRNESGLVSGKLSFEKKWFNQSQKISKLCTNPKL